MQFREDIQILRGIAVTLVVLFHLELSGLASGFLGVDIFFVVSGFLMAILYKTGEAKKFLKRRASRLLPAYFVTILLTLIASIFLVIPSELTQVIDQSIYGLFFTNNVGFWMQNSYFSKIEFNPLLHLWSLGVELQFYLFVPLLAWIFAKSKLFLPIFILGSLACCFFLLGISPKTSFFMMPFRVWEFLIGFGVAYYLTNNGTVKYKDYSWLGLLGLLIVVIIPFLKVDGEALNPIHGHPGLYALLVCLATALIIGFGLPKIVSNSIFGKVFEKLGNYSYSIYLVHFPIIVLYLYEPFGGTRLYPETIEAKVTIIFLIAIFSFLMYSFVEKRRIENIYKLYFSAVALILLGVLGAKSTFTAFYSEKEQNIFNGLVDRDTYRCGKIARIVNPKDLTCKINEGDFEKSILLVGNSHADSIKKSFQEIAAKHKFNTYFLVSNTPLVSGEITVDALLKEAQRLNVKKIVLHYSPNSIKVKTIEKLVLESQKYNIHIDFIMPIPIYDDSIPKLIYLNKTDLYGQDIYLERNKEFIDQVNLMASAMDNLKAFPVHEVFCNNICEVSDQNSKPYYFDSTHLTITGSKKLDPVFEDIFK